MFRLHLEWDAVVDDDAEVGVAHNHYLMTTLTIERKSVEYERHAIVGIVCAPMAVGHSHVCGPDVCLLYLMGGRHNVQRKNGFF